MLDDWQQEKLILPADIVARIDCKLQKARQVNDMIEIGGEMMGEVVGPDVFRLLSISCTRGVEHRFEYRPEDHQAEFEAFFRTPGHTDHDRFRHFGVWHSHPVHGPDPSVLDYATARNQMRQSTAPFNIIMVVAPLDVGFDVRARMLTRDGRWTWLEVERE